VTVADTVSATVKPSEDEEKQRKEQQNSQHVDHNVAVQYDHTLLQYMGRWCFECNDIIAMKMSEIL
jgi:nitrate reductase beta subunit